MLPSVNQDFGKKQPAQKPLTARPLDGMPGSCGVRTAGGVRTALVTLHTKIIITYFSGREKTQRDKIYQLTSEFSNYMKQ